MGKFWKVIIVLVFLVTTVTCSTTVGFNIYDNDTGNTVPEYTVHIEGKILQPGDTIELSTAVWKEYQARIQANGYRTENKALEKDVYIGRAIVGYFLWWPALLWCYGPKANQVFYLSRSQS